MRSTVFGSTGTTGLQVVRECLAKEFEVTAYTRQQTFPMQHPQLDIVRGALDDIDHLVVVRQEEQA